MPSDQGVKPVPPGCPRCGAHTRIGAQWCTLCYADLRPAPDATRRPDPALVTVPPTPAAEARSERAPESAPATPVTGPGRGKHARHDSTVEHHQSESDSEPATRSAHASEVLSPDAMLVLLAAESSKPLPGLSGRLESKGSRIALTVGGMAMIAVLLFAVMAVLGMMV